MDCYGNHGTAFAIDRNLSTNPTPVLRRTTGSHTGVNRRHAVYVDQTDSFNKRSVYYRPHESDQGSLLELEKSLELSRSPNGSKLILGDFNFPKLLWDAEHTPSHMECYSSNDVNDKFLEVLDDHSLTKMVSENTRQESTRNLFLTSNMTLVNHVEIIPGVYIDSTQDRALSKRSAVLMEEGADEKTPLLGEDQVVKKILEQTSTLENYERGLLSQGESLSAATADFQKMPPKTAGLWKRLCPCCCGSDID